MSQPAVTLTELDGSLGVLPPSSGKLLAVVGVSSTGTANTPATYARITDLVAAFGAGPMVEAAAHHIRTTGRPVVVVKTGATTAAAATAVTLAGTGTSVGTVSSATLANDDYEVAVKIVTGGTRGVAGVTYQVSLDGGRTYGATLALGTDISITIPGAGGVILALAAGTFVAGDVYSFRTSAAAPNGSEVTAALTALQNWIGAWGIVLLAFPLDATLFDAVDAAIAAMRGLGKYRAWVGNTRVPNIAESESAYKTALDAIFASKASKTGALCAGAVKHTSAVTGRKYKRPVSFIAASLEANVEEHINTADVNLGPLTAVSIKTANGNADEHDESINPGLDDSRFYVLRTWEGIEGTYVNIPRTFAATGSDFRLLTHRRVMNLACETLKPFLQTRLNKPIRVDPKTGFILESEALEIEAGARRILEAALMSVPKASAVAYTLSRTDNLLSTRRLNGQARIVPLAYAEELVTEIGFSNPALTTVSA